MLESEDFYLNSKNRIDIDLIAKAAGEVKSTPTSSAQRETYSQRVWTDGCQDVLGVYYRDFYSQIRPGSPEDVIAKLSDVKTTSGEVFELPAGKTFGLPKPLSAYVAIPLAVKGDVTVEVVNKFAHEEIIEWDMGAMVYLKGTVGLKCCGEGSVVCIMLALNPGEE